MFIAKTVASSCIMVQTNSGTEPLWHRGDQTGTGSLGVIHISADAR